MLLKVILFAYYNIYFDTVFYECYNEACKAAAVETQLPLATFPESSPFTKSDVLDVNVDDYFIE